MKRVLILYNTTKYLVRFRQRFVQTLQNSGVEVHALTPEDEYVPELIKLGVKWHPWKLARHGKNPFADLASLWEVVRVMRKVRPNAIFNVTLKAVLYGGIAAMIVGTRRRISLIAGLGNMVSGRGLLSYGVRVIYAGILRRYHGIVVQNSDDENAIRQLLGSRAANSTVLRVPGSGVDLDLFSPSNRRTSGTPVVMMVTRLVWDKGLREFCSAASRIGGEANFVLIGALDSNPDSPTVSEIQALAAEAGVELKLDVEDVATELQRATIFVYPSYYPEGIPRSILEALAIGLPIITTLAPGCRESIEDGKQGYLVPPRDADALAQKLHQLLSDSRQIERLGVAARARAEALYDERIIGARMANFVLPS
jgi:glycosyltransferase involved in cell wall biosynthesis